MLKVAQKRQSKSICGEKKKESCPHSSYLEFSNDILLVKLVFITRLTLSFEFYCIFNNFGLKFDVFFFLN